jgi:hypothetical protein
LKHQNRCTLIYNLGGKQNEPYLKLLEEDRANTPQVVFVVDAEILPGDCLKIDVFLEVGRFAARLGRTNDLGILPYFQAGPALLYKIKYI